MYVAALVQPLFGFGMASTLGQKKRYLSAAKNQPVHVALKTVPARHAATFKMSGLEANMGCKSERASEQRYSTCCRYNTVQCAP